MNEDQDDDVVVDAELLPEPDDLTRIVTLSSYEWRRIRRALHDAATKSRAKAQRHEADEALTFFVTGTPERWRD